MAIWQYKINYFEKIKTEQKFSEIPTSLNHEDWYDISDDFKFNNTPTKINLINFIEHTGFEKIGVKPFRSWSTHITAFKDDNDTEIEISDHSELLTPSYSVRYSIDVRYIKRQHLEFAIELGEYLNAYLYDFRNIFPPDIEMLIEGLKVSTAYKFCQDPYGTLEEIGKRGLQ